MPKYIRRNHDGAIVEIPPEYAPENEFWWTDGNMGCDCNREVVFEYVTGKTHPSHTGNCLPEGRFDILDSLQEK